MEYTMKKNILIAVTLGTAISGTTLFAAQTELKSGVVFGLQAGISGFQGQPDGAPGTTTYKAGFIGGATIGYDYAVTPNVAIGVESGFNYSPQTYRIEQTSTGALGLNINTMNVPLLLTAKYLTPINVTVFGKAGYSYNRYMLSADGESDYNYSKWAPMMAAGVGYQLNNFHFFGQYTHTFGKDMKEVFSSGEEDTISTNTVTVGVTYTLPLSF